MSEPSAFAAGSRAGSSQGRDGVDVMACARAGAGASSGTSGATGDSAKPSTAAAGPAVFGTPLNSSSPPALRATLRGRSLTLCLSARANLFGQPGRRHRRRTESARLFRRLDCTRTKHISCLIFDKSACVPDEAGAAAGEELVNTATAAPAEATPAKK